MNGGVSWAEDDRFSRPGVGNVILQDAIQHLGRPPLRVNGIAHEVMDEDHGEFLRADACQQRRLIPESGVCQLRHLERLEIERLVIEREQPHELIRQHRPLGASHIPEQVAQPRFGPQARLQSLHRSLEGLAHQKAQLHGQQNQRHMPHSKSSRLRGCQAGEGISRDPHAGHDAERRREFQQIVDIGADFTDGQGREACADQIGAGEKPGCIRLWRLAFSRSQERPCRYPQAQRAESQQNRQGLAHIAPMAQQRFHVEGVDIGSDNVEEEAASRGELQHQEQRQSQPADHCSERGSALPAVAVPQPDTRGERRRQAVGLPGVDRSHEQQRPADQPAARFGAAGERRQPGCAQRQCQQIHPRQR